MPCNHVKIGDAEAIICTRGRGPRRCYKCSRPVAVLCDAPVGKGKSCDRPACKEHSVHAGPDLDYCDEHREVAKQMELDNARV